MRREDQATAMESHFPKPISVAIGAKVRSRRIEGGLSEEAVARVLECDVKHLQAAEAGEINFSPENIVDLCPVLRVVPSWFFEDLA